MKKLLISLAVVFFGVMSSSVFAAPPAEVGTGATELATEIPLYAALFVGVAIAKVLGSAVIKWTKSFGMKAI